MPHTTLLYASDLHGSEAFFRKFISATLTYKAQVAVVGGDVTGKAMVPIVRRNGVYEGYLFGNKETASTAGELEALKTRISNVGFYPLLLTPDEQRALESDQQKMDAAFLRLMKERVEEWMALAEEHLKPKGARLFFMAGNDDLHEIDEAISTSSFVMNPDGRRFQLDDHHEIVGLGAANMTPWQCPRDMEEADLLNRLEAVMGLLANPAQAVCVFHVPPYDSQLDLAPALDKNLKIEARGGQVLLKAVGSTSVRQVIEKYQPLLTLHGHIHESSGFRKIGRTLCVNAGSEYAEGIMRAALINLEKDTVKGYMPLSA
jgi:Icc-related predicted phosphoesterase